MSKKNKKFQADHDHGPPVTRRDFITRGLMSGGAFLLAPSVLGMFLKTQIAQAALNCPSAVGPSGLVPFLSIDCAGGAGLSANAVVGSQTSGALVLLPSYSKRGLTYSPASTPGSIDSRFGTSFHVGPSPADSTRPISKVFEGIIGAASASTQANTRIVTICHSSQDDTSSNELNPVLSVARSGLIGRYFKNGIGNYNSASGGNSAPSLVDGTLRPFTTYSLQGILNSLSYGETLRTYALPYKTKMAKALSTLGQLQGSKFASLPQNEQFQNLVNCGLISNEGLAAIAAPVDPRLDANMQSIYGITSTSLNGDAFRAAIVYNVLMGNSGPSTFVESGCDYHNSKLPGDPSHGDVTDLQIGKEIGRALEAAARLGKPLFIAVFSDGSVTSTPDTRVWTGDDGSASLALLVMYKPGGIANNKQNQIGSYGIGQSVLTTPFYAKNPQFVSYVMLANYLSVSGQLGLFPSLAPVGFPTDSATVNSIIGFG